MTSESELPCHDGPAALVSESRSRFDLASRRHGASRDVSLDSEDRHAATDPGQGRGRGLARRGHDRRAGEERRRGAAEGSGRGSGRRKPGFMLSRYI